MGACASGRAGDHHIKVNLVTFLTNILNGGHLVRDVSPHPLAENMESNNNIAAVVHQDRLYLAWRTAPLHFAGRDTRSVLGLQTSSEYI